MATTSTKRPAPADQAAPAKSPKPKPILSIDLAPERPYLTLDDVRHDFRLRQEFGAIEDAEFQSRSREYDALYQAPERDEAEEKRMLELLEWLIDKVLVDAGKLREQVGEKLTGAMKREIVLTFSNAPLLMAAMAQQTEMETDQVAEDSSTIAS